MVKPDVHLKRRSLEGIRDAAITASFQHVRMEPLLTQ